MDYSQFNDNRNIAYLRLTVWFGMVCNISWCTPFAIIGYLTCDVPMLNVVAILSSSQDEITFYASGFMYWWVNAVKCYTYRQMLPIQTFYVEVVRIHNILLLWVCQKLQYNRKIPCVFRHVYVHLTYGFAFYVGFYNFLHTFLCHKRMWSRGGLYHIHFECDYGKLYHILLGCIAFCQMNDTFWYTDCTSLQKFCPGLTGGSTCGGGTILLSACEWTYSARGNNALISFLMANLRSQAARIMLYFHKSTDHFNFNTTTQH